MKTKLRVLSLGAGVQSSTLSLMIEKGLIPKVDCGIFADTMGEPKLVYSHLEWLEKQLSFPIHRVKKGDLKQDMINAVDGKYNFLTIPLYTINSKTGKKGLLRRQCTNDYKIQPIVQQIRRLLKLKKRQKVKKDMVVEMLMGISYDEIYRIKTNRLPYITNIYPLVEMKMRRLDCLNWMKDNGYPKPPRSACTFCPYHSNKEWREIKKDKAEWDEVIALDKVIRFGTRKKEDQVFLHKSCTPIDQVDLSDPKDNQLNLFNAECEGYCGN
jgi:hypothetical protein